MDHDVPILLNVFFLATVIIAVLLLNAAARSKVVLAVSLAWIALQSAVSFSGFYGVTDSVPPRFFLVVGPPIVVAVAVCLVPAGKRLIDTMDLRWTVLFHTIRILVEVTLFWLFCWKQVPALMTFEHGNLDILVGLTAPLIWLAYSKGSIGNKGLFAWNALALLSLSNAVGRALLSAPFPFQKLALDQPTVAILHFPFTLLPAFIVPAAFLCHLAIFRKLLAPKA
jgi:hypothetical protein